MPAESLQARFGSCRCSFPRRSPRDDLVGSLRLASFSPVESLYLAYPHSDPATNFRSSRPCRLRGVLEGKIGAWSYCPGSLLSGRYSDIAESRQGCWGTRRVCIRVGGKP